MKSDARSCAVSCLRSMASCDRDAAADSPHRPNLLLNITRCRILPLLTPLLRHKGEIDVLLRPSAVTVERRER